MLTMNHSNYECLQGALYFLKTFTDTLSIQSVSDKACICLTLKLYCQTHLTIPHKVILKSAGRG